MSTEALAAWLRVRRCQAVERQALGKGIRPPLEGFKPRTNATLLSPRAQLPHHRIFWREETTSESLWEGARRSIEAAKKEGVACSPGDYENERASVEDREGQEKRRLGPAAILREVSKFSDLERLSRLLIERKINAVSPEIFAAVLRDGNPAIVETILRHERDHGGAQFLEAFRSWGDVRDAGRPARCLPLHTSCHAGSPEILSVLLEFMADSYSRENFKSLVNARDSNGRSALQLASWSPRPQCPGKRHNILRNLLAHGADVRAKDNRGCTALHEACRAADCFAVEVWLCLIDGRILLKNGADPLQEDNASLKPLETATRGNRRLLDGVFRKHLPPESYLHLWAIVTAKHTVSRIMRRFVPPCDTCRVRPAAKCDAQKNSSFAAWLYTHKRWPKAGQGKWREVRPSCVEKKTSTKKVKRT